MKEIFEHLGTFIPDFPTTHVMYLGDEDEEFISSLQELSKQRAFVFDIGVFEGGKYPRLDIKSLKYNTKGYQYDTIFLNLKSSPTSLKKHLFERIYASMKNAGGLIICLPFEDEFSYEIEYFLEDLNYVAINCIELSQKVKTIYAKKMHGWGGAR